MNYAQTCVQYVEKNIGVRLDFTVETLPILDHYLREARSAGAERPEATVLVATVAGCYLGEVLRVRHDLSWTLEGEDPLTWKLTDPSGALTVFPVALVQVALDGPRAERELAMFTFEPSLDAALSRRLDLLPQVTEEEYIAPSTRVEVVDIAIDLLTGAKQLKRDCGCGDDCDCNS